MRLQVAIALSILLLICACKVQSQAAVIKAGLTHYDAQMDQAAANDSNDEQGYNHPEKGGLGILP